MTLDNRVSGQYRNAQHYAQKPTGKPSPGSYDADQRALQSVEMTQRTKGMRQIYDLLRLRVRGTGRGRKPCVLRLSNGPHPDDSLHLLSTGQFALTTTGRSDSWSQITGADGPGPRESKIPNLDIGGFSAKH